MGFFWRIGGRVPWGTTERGNGVGSVVFTHKAAAIMVSSVLLLTTFVFYFDGNKIRLSEKSRQFLRNPTLLLHWSFFSA